MGGIGSVNNLGPGAQEYGSLSAQRKRPETEPDPAALDNLTAEQPSAEQQSAVAQTRREAAPEIVCPRAQEVPEIMAGLVSGISQSPAWKLGEIQPAGKTRLVSPAYV
jgi:hypothetical protein